MSYNWGKERRRGSDRREPLHAPYAGPERRQGERRQIKPRRHLGGWLIGALVGFVLADSLIWHGYYFHSAVASFNADAAKTRAWSDNIWHFS